MANELMNRNNDLFGMGNDRFFNNLAHNFFGNDLAFPNLWDDNLGLMKTDVKETDKAYEVKIDLPGLKKENIHIDYADGVLSVSGDREDEKDEKDKKGHVVHSERYAGSYSRQYTLPNVDRDAIKAGFKHGVLTIDLPKAVKDSKAKQIAID
ncbi:MAG: Hsp20/alpha crystallin family protein [Streptococcaceae bacterium]|jgi:HSP20 family protein|nr:Hsp20/alpha crystallin family protein [Streptococcaceae bacterium]